MDCSLPGSSVHGNSCPGKNWSGLPCPPPGYLPDPGIEPMSNCVSCISRRVLYYYTTTYNVIYRTLHIILDTYDNCLQRGGGRINYSLLDKIYLHICD